MISYYNLYDSSPHLKDKQFIVIQVINSKSNHNFMHMTKMTTSIRLNAEKRFYSFFMILLY